MNNCEQKVVITIAILLAVVLTIVTCCVTYYNLARLKSEQISVGKPTESVLYIHKLDDKQFSQFLNALRSDAAEIVKTEEKSK